MNTAPQIETQPGTGTDIGELRQEIDTLDAEILELINRRAEKAALLAQERTRAGLPARSHSTESALYEKLTGELGDDGRELASIHTSLAHRAFHALKD